MERLARADHDGRQFFGLFARVGANGSYHRRHVPQSPITHCLRYGSRSLRAGFQSKTQIDRRVQFSRRSVVPTAVDKERRGAIHAAAHATEEIVSDLGRVLPGRQRLLQPGLRQSKGLCQGQKDRQAKPMLIFVDRVVHPPKFATRAGEFSGLRGGFRVGVNLRQWKMPVDEPQPVAKMPQHELDHWMGGAAVRAFVIPIFDKRDASFWGTLDMIIRSNWRFQCRHGS